ncbi:Thioredoxin-like_superfamily [Hexamita inflata]|uniref:Thioredoxin-like superfamily n=1 Tax=Hexamita inflata TaxID=28002 RepID=A0AA86V584_9EUKA|nr:Thioredoxin-like superfamily [Hexamita inflata]
MLICSLALHTVQLKYRNPDQIEDLKAQSTSLVVLFTDSNTSTDYFTVLDELSDMFEGVLSFSALNCSQFSDYCDTSDISAPSTFMFNSRFSYDPSFVKQFSVENVLNWVQQNQKMPSNFARTIRDVEKPAIYVFANDSLPPAIQRFVVYNSFQNIYNDWKMLTEILRSCEKQIPMVVMRRENHYFQFYDEFTVRNLDKWAEETLALEIKEEEEEEQARIHDEL